MISKELFIEILKSMPTSKKCKIKIGENDYACQQLKCSLEQIKLHNAENEGFGQGYEDAVKDYIKWRDETLSKVIFNKK